MKLSILIAAFNVEKYIEKCILSCTNQDILEADYEIIVVDDGSTDKTYGIIEELNGKINNLRIVKQENKGLGGARNTGMQNAQGDYIWLIDGDDYITSNCLGQIVKRVINDQLDVLVLDYNIENEQGHLISENANPVILKESIVNGGSYYKFYYEKSYSWLFIIKRSLIEEKKIVFMDRINMQDSEIQPRILQYVNRLSYLNRCCYVYVQSIDSFTNSVNCEKRYAYFESIIAVRNSFNSFLLKSSAINPDLAYGLRMKLEKMPEIFFNHLLYFNYSRKCFRSIIKLLIKNDLFPLRLKVDGWKGFMLKSLNAYPYITYALFGFLRRLKHFLE